jgi:hypothetical protein
MIVHEPPALTTEPLAQVPPVIANVPPAVPTLVTLGAAVNVNGPAVAPVAVLLTVMVPLCAVVVPVTSEGVGPANVIVAPVTVNVTALVVPASPVLPTVTLRALKVAVALIAQLALTVVAVGAGATMVQVTPVPETFTAFAFARLVPVNVTGTVVPRRPLTGLIVFNPVMLPVSVDVCVPAKSVTDTVADTDALVLVGRNWTVTAQDAPGARVVNPIGWIKAPCAAPQVDNKDTRLN